jgi:hypothetical protein
VQRLVVRRDRTARGGRVRRLGVVDEADAADLGHLLEAMRHAREGAKPLRDLLLGRSGGARRRCGGGGVLPVVPPGDPRLRRQRVFGRELDAPRRSRVAEASRHDGGVVGALVLEDAQLRVAVRLEAPVTVEVIRLQVQEHGDARTELDDVLELEAGELADDPLIGGDLAVELGQRPADVPGHRRAQHRPEQLARGRLAVRPGDAEDRVRQQARAELDLAPDRYAPLSRSGDEGRLAGHSGALDQHVHSLQQRGLLRSQVNFDTRRLEPPRVDVRRAVDTDHLLPAAGQRERRRLPRAREPEDERLHDANRSGRKPRRYW